MGHSAYATSITLGGNFKGGQSSLRNQSPMSTNSNSYQKKKKRQEKVKGKALQGVQEVQKVHEDQEGQEE